MDWEDLPATYEPFVSESRKGRLLPPSQRWTAEQVAAHDATGNDLLAAVVAGGQPHVDNDPAVDDSRLRASADEVDGLPGLVTAIETSAARLASAGRAPNETSGSYRLPVRLADNSIVVRDATIPIAEFIAENDTSHLATHLAQRRALRA